MPRVKGHVSSAEGSTPGRPDRDDHCHPGDIQIQSVYARRTSRSSLARAEEACGPRWQGSYRYRLCKYSQFHENTVNEFVPR